MLGQVMPRSNIVLLMAHMYIAIQEFLYWSIVKLVIMWSLLVYWNALIVGLQNLVLQRAV